MKSFLYYLLSIAITATLISLSACDKDSDDNPIDPTEASFSISSKYDSIRSYPDGGGIFVMHATFKNGFTGKISLSSLSESDLNVKLTKTTLSKADNNFNVIISPSASISNRHHKIKIKAVNNGKEIIRQLDVNVFEWGENIDDAKNKLEPFKVWIQQNRPELLSAFDIHENIYSTYPQILIVEHYTFLNSEYETRLCYHVMVPPYDWSKLLIRKLDKIEPEIALQKDNEEIVYPIEISEYPILLGY